MKKEEIKDESHDVDDLLFKRECKKHLFWGLAGCVGSVAAVCAGTSAGITMGGILPALGIVGGMATFPLASINVIESVGPVVEDVLDHHRARTRCRRESIIERKIIKEK